LRKERLHCKELLQVEGPQGQTTGPGFGRHNNVEMIKDRNIAIFPSVSGNDWQYETLI
jgi:hypothetical protein